MFFVFCLLIPVYTLASKAFRGRNQRFQTYGSDQHDQRESGQALAFIDGHGNDRGDS
jgi:hypothetical protein